MTDYFFSSNVTDFVCPGWLFGDYDWTCTPPSACAADSTSNKQYCCNAGDASPAVCWAPSSVCSGSGSTFTCSSGSYTWCCLTDKETCTQLAGQINICYSLADDVLANVSSSVLNNTYSSLSSAQPSASSYTFDPLALIAQTQTTSVPIQTTSTQTQTTSTQSATATNSPRPSLENHSSNSLSGGAIAGIVIAVVAAIAVACLAAFLLVRRRQRKQNRLTQAATSQVDPKHIWPAQEYKGDPEHMPKEMQADTTHVVELGGNIPQEMEGGTARVAELRGNIPQEMEGGTARVAELPGDRGRS